MDTSRTVVITGITAGLGLALTRELLQQGHRVHGCGRRDDPLQGTSFPGSPGRYRYRKLDITDRTSLADWAATIEADGQPVDTLIHNAAVIHENAPLWEIRQDRLDAVIDINIKGTFNVLRAFLPMLLKRRHGMIVTLSSGAGRNGFPEISGYCASKWAVEGLTKSLAAELPDGMAAIPMSPGIVDTDMLRSTFGESAADHPKADAWARIAVPFILGLKAGQSGQSLTVPVV